MLLAGLDAFRDRASMPLHPDAVPEQKEWSEAARHRLTTAEYEAAVEKGRALTLEELIEYARRTLEGIIDTIPEQPGHTP